MFVEAPGASGPDLRSSTPGPSISSAWVMVPLLTTLNVQAPGANVDVDNESLYSVSPTVTVLPLSDMPALVDVIEVAGAELDVAAAVVEDPLPPQPASSRPIELRAANAAGPRVVRFTLFIPSSSLDPPEGTRTDDPGGSEARDVGTAGHPCRSSRPRALAPE